MAEYLRPDVFVQRENTGAEPIQSQGTATAGFVGISRRGVIGVATLVTSWTDFVNKFAGGLDTPFMRNSDLAYAVYGYFQNGGGRAYVVRVASDTASKATIKVPASTGVEFSAKEEGTWGNKLEVTVTGSTKNYKVVVEYDGEQVEVFEGLSETSGDATYFFDVINENSKFISVSSTGTFGAGTGIFVTGADGIDDIDDTDYTGTKGLEALSSASDVTIVAVPGQHTIAQDIIDYCAGRGDCFGIVDLDMGLTTQEAVTAKESIVGEYGAVYYPWGKVADPLVAGKQRVVPPSGHIAGIYARTDRDRGVFKAPAGVDATVRGFTELETRLANGDIEVLNPLGVNCIVAKPNKGIVVWGARLASPNRDRAYVSDMRLDIAIEEALYEGTQWTIFEPNDEKLWGTVTAQIKAYLYGLWVEGALFGAEPAEAYFVKCDGELNTQEIRDAGKVIIEVGYAKKKPAEFTILKITQKASN